MIIKCPITGKYYQRFNFNKYHFEDCPYCKNDKRYNNKSK